jgi:transcriptional regulator GlxA family with amidase domain
MSIGVQIFHAENTVRPSRPVAAEAKEFVASGKALHMAVVCAGRNLQQHVEKNLDKWRRECRERRITLAAVCTGPYLWPRPGF